MRNGGEGDFGPEQNIVERERAEARLSFLDRIIKNPAKYVNPKRVFVAISLAATLFSSGCAELGKENSYSKPPRVEVRLSESDQPVEHMITGSHVKLEQLAIFERPGVVNTGWESGHRAGNDFVVLDAPAEQRDPEETMQLEYSSDKESLPAEELYPQLMLDLQEELKKQGCALVAAPIAIDDRRTFDYESEYRSIVSPDNIIRGTGPIWYRVPGNQNPASEYRLTLPVAHTDAQGNFQVKVLETTLKAKDLGAGGRHEVVIDAHDLDTTELMSIGYVMAAQAGSDWTVHGKLDPRDGRYHYAVDYKKLQEAIIGYMALLQHASKESGHGRPVMTIAIAQTATIK